MHNYIIIVCTFTFLIYNVCTLTFGFVYFNICCMYCIFHCIYCMYFYVHLYITFTFTFTVYNIWNYHGFFVLTHLVYTFYVVSQKCIYGSEVFNQNCLKFCVWTTVTWLFSKVLFLYIFQHQSSRIPVTRLTSSTCVKPRSVEMNW